MKMTNSRFSKNRVARTQAGLPERHYHDGVYASSWRVFQEASGSGRDTRNQTPHR